MIHLIIGKTGAGKTTYIQQLNQNTKSVIFSIDEWNNTLFLPDKQTTDGLNWFLERIERNEKMIMSIIIQLEANQTDSFLDLGFAKFEHREKFRQYAKKNTLEYKLHYLDVDKNTRKSRVQKRNLQKGTTFQFIVSDDDFEFMENWFEPPTLAELEKAVIVK